MKYIFITMVFLRFKNDTNSLLLQCPKYLTKVINASRSWTPTLEMNTKTKIAKGPRTTGRTDILYCHSGDLTHGLRLHALHAIMGRANDRQKATRTT